MPTITIDGKVCEFEGKKTILQVAYDNGIDIPHYCYHPGMSVVASCRICLAEVAAPNPRNDNKVELMPKLMPTCQTMASDKMEVYVDSPKSIANQKAVMEYLLINHPLDCPVCDQAGECYLQDYSFEYGRGESRFEEDKIKQATKDLGPYVKLYSDRCIMCSRCIRFTREVSGTGEIGVFGRGAHEEIDIFPGKALDNELSGNVVDICPVGALLDKDFLFTQRVWFLNQSPSVDGITASGDNLWVHHNEGVVYRVKPRTCPDVNKWWISDEIRYGWKFVHREDRLVTPMREQVGTLDQTTWAGAYAAVRDGVKKAVSEGGEGSLAVMISPMLPCEEAYLLAKWARGMDPQALLAVGPVPRQGEDKTFPGGYTIYAEKAPNARGVRRVLEQVAGAGDASASGGVLDYEALLAKLGEGACKAIVLTGNYPSETWLSKDLQGTFRGRFVTLIDTLPSPAMSKAQVVLPGATWLEKAGTFENATGRLQAFEQAVPVVEGAKREGQIAIDLLAACDLAEPGIHDAARVREELGGVFATDVHLPAPAKQTEPDMQYVTL